MKATGPKPASRRHWRSTARMVPRLFGRFSGLILLHPSPPQRHEATQFDGAEHREETNHGSAAPGREWTVVAQCCQAPAAQSTNHCTKRCKRDCEECDEESKGTGRMSSHPLAPTILSQFDTKTNAVSGEPPRCGGESEPEYDCRHKVHQIHLSEPNVVRLSCRRSGDRDWQGRSSRTAPGACYARVRNRRRQ